MPEPIRYIPRQDAIATFPSGHIERFHTVRDDAFAWRFEALNPVTRVTHVTKGLAQTQARAWEMLDARAKFSGKGMGYEIGLEEVTEQLERPGLR